ncbi:MAG: hypothetical protein CSA04_05920 [Bacteroidetes bacterium]|nr:MAG: hypothetical protein CSA04_05920 [Bacteroidota bacterium]
MITKLFPEQRLAKAIEENPSLLFMLEYFNISHPIKHKTIADICAENQINPYLMILIGDMYNGKAGQPDITHITAEDIPTILSFLKNTHKQYIKEKYPEIETLIGRLKEISNPIEFTQLETFFREYFAEVIEHLDYEDKYAFPYFYEILTHSRVTGHSFSAADYKNHHSDIETKLSDLKTLLLQHISMDKGISIRRKILLKLFELQKDLTVHSKIEEQILLPIVEKLEHGR